MKRSSSRVSVAAVFVSAICFATPLFLKAANARAPSARVRGKSGAAQRTTGGVQERETSKRGEQPT